MVSMDVGKETHEDWVCLVCRIPHLSIYQTSRADSSFSIRKLKVLNGV